jgi:[phosphatase 2A protein]-leucine-carboxy methyltransferase
MSAPEIPNLLSLRGGPRSRRGGRGALNSGQFPRPGAMDNQADADKRIRDTDNDASLSRLSAVKLGYLDDPFAKEFVIKDPNIRRQPLINRGERAPPIFVL